jgi:hypothetical protein
MAIFPDRIFARRRRDQLFWIKKIYPINDLKITIALSHDQHFMQAGFLNLIKKE